MSSAAPSDTRRCRSLLFWCWESPTSRCRWPIRRRLGEHRLLLLGGVGRNLWLGLIPLAPASSAGLAMVAASEFLSVLFAGMFSPTFATYRMNATDDAHMSRVVMAWSVTNKVVQPLCIAAAGALAAATSARTALTVLAAVLLTGIPLLPWRARSEIVRT